MSTHLKTETQSIAPKPITAESMILRPAEERGSADHGWLRARHSFSFGGYHDPRFMGHGHLRVINDDRIAASGGFPTHPHQNMEIFSYILEGALSHKDSMGNGSTVRAGGVQYMSAGRGVRHSEFNPSESENMRLLQIWLLPNSQNEEPRYETLDFTAEERMGKLKLFLSHDGRNGSIRARTNSDVYSALLDAKQTASFTLPEGHSGWVQLAKGEVTMNGLSLREGDGVALTKGGEIHFSDAHNADIIVFDMWA